MEETGQSKIDLTTFLFSVSSAAFMHLGLFPSEESQEAKNSEINLEAAKHNIDLLEMIEEKTKGNRTEDEEKLIQQLLSETRLQYVKVKDQKATE